MRYKARQIYKWSESLAYIVGLITADGCLLNDNRHIDFTSKDIQLATLFRDTIRPSVKVGIKFNGSGLPCYRVQFGDVAFYDFLLSIGLTQNKSLTISEIEIPSDFFADFLRGYFDGDGCIYGVWDKRWKNSYMFYTSFVCASLPFLKWLQLKISLNLPEVEGSIRFSGKGTYQLSYAKHDSRKLFNFMYYNDTVLCLHRKRQRYLEVFATDPYAK